jgi:hypothetical protein
MTYFSEDTSLERQINLTKTSNMDLRTDAWRSRYGKQSRDGRIWPGLTRTRNQPEEQEIQAEYYEAYKYPWLEKVFANIRRKSSTRQKIIESKVISFKVTFLTYIIIMHL